MKKSSKLKIINIKKLSLFFATFLFTFSVQMQAQTCSGFGSVLRDSWQQVYTIAHPIGESALTLIPVVGQNQQAVDAISQVSANFHNFVFNGNRQSWATVGARELPVLKDQIKQFGTLRKAGVGGVRVFTTAPLFWDKVIIEIQKIEGRAETDVFICTWDMESGVKNNYVEYKFKSGKNTETKKFIITNVHGKSISVKLRNRSVTNKFKYAIKSKGFLNIAKQRTRGMSNSSTNTRARRTIRRNN
ncbi:hypothetical protein [Lutibacter sp.]